MVGDVAEERSRLRRDATDVGVRELLHRSLQRLDGVPNVFASPVGAKGRVYFPGQEGTTLVIKHGPAYEVLAKNVLDDGFNASPALVDNEIYLRGFKNLYSIGR